jgi:hypothetical protein
LRGHGTDAPFGAPPPFAGRALRIAKGFFLYLLFAARFLFVDQHSDAQAHREKVIVLSAAGEAK